MKKIILHSENNYVLRPLTGKIFIDDVFFDYIQLKVDKELVLPKQSKKLYIKADWLTSNVVELNEDNLTLKIYSKVQNSFFVYSCVCVFLSVIWSFLQNYIYFNTYISMALLMPMLIIVGKQVFQRKEFIIIERIG
ncbi:MAG: hypothetical protein Q4A09_07520 [Capnocytophaga felis]|nr:hypothetical protein [Capnocytophaga felis]